MERKKSRLTPKLLKCRHRCVFCGTTDIGWYLASQQTCAFTFDISLDLLSHHGARFMQLKSHHHTQKRTLLSDTGSSCLQTHLSACRPGPHPLTPASDSRGSPGPPLSHCLQTQASNFILFSCLCPLTNTKIICDLSLKRRPDSLFSVGL